VPEICTCGAQLPPDARFCHKCGKPQRDEPHLNVEETPPPPPPPPALPAEPPPISLRNVLAVRAALPAGIIAFLLSALLRQLGLVALIGGGVLAVYFYRRYTGQKLSVANGARLGWITGIFLFVPLLITFTASLLTEPGLMASLREQLAQSSLTQAQIEQSIEILNTPAGKAGLVLAMFLSSTLLPAFGGAVGAKLLRRS
jgi:hypothetical protein